MLFKTALSAAAAATSVLAAPLESRAEKFFTPSVIWHYSVNNGAISSTVSGEVFKDVANHGQDVTTLLTFRYPEQAEGLQCQFAFYVDDTACLDGSKQLDLFTSYSPAPGPTAGWGPGNQRNVPLGRLSLGLNSFATWDATYSTYLTEKTPCKPHGTIEAFELVGVNDNDLVTWNPETGAGPRIIYSS
ncbi:hypothetical protein EDB81DRAFT_908314 [Dactylonectria macrodidyma]|uniref:Ubiquitin 3 binding protein But2 C-terminal domain-containing protein n=1 Tax=Dactylonectria macrodidyma TaxID=307937 RepID=A0A9P9JKX5_9HYPO|nr:hypothetical protein EDB81DRAFT_908314 [Dactylonectria macrodidyma]